MLQIWNDFVRYIQSLFTVLHNRQFKYIIKSEIHVHPDEQVDENVTSSWSQMCKLKCQNSVFQSHKVFLAKKHLLSILYDFKILKLESEARKSFFFINFFQISLTATATAAKWIRIYTTIYFDLLKILVIPRIRVYHTHERQLELLVVETICTMHGFKLKDHTT